MEHPRICRHQRAILAIRPNLDSTGESQRAKTEVEEIEGGKQAGGAANAQIPTAAPTMTDTQKCFQI
jgi:hypothetical protein